MVRQNGIRLKKKYGQHFLTQEIIVHHMVEAVEINNESSVFEIGCGDGFLTRMILQTKMKHLWIYEIDPEWAEYVAKTFPDPRTTIFTENFLDIDFSSLEEYAPWTVLANLPYQVTFPILHKLQINRHLLKEGVLMMQEEVAQKINKSRGRDYGFASLFFQWFFELQLLDKIHPSAFNPPPKVFSRLVYFKPRTNIPTIPDEQQFWQFIKVCFKQPRRTLRNNLNQTQYDMTKISSEQLGLRSQQLNMNDFLILWDVLR